MKINRFEFVCCCSFYFFFCNLIEFDMIISILIYDNWVEIWIRFVFCRRGWEFMLRIADWLLSCYFSLFNGHRLWWLWFICVFESWTNLNLILFVYSRKLKNWIFYCSFMTIFIVFFILFVFRKCESSFQCYAKKV